MLETIRALQTNPTGRLGLAPSALYFSRCSYSN